MATFENVVLKPNVKFIVMEKLYFILVIAAILVSCQNNDDAFIEVYESHVPISSDDTFALENRLSEIDEEEKYEKHIRTIAKGLLQLSQNVVFKQLVADEAALAFDGDENVLLRVINDKLQVNGGSMAAIFLASLNDSYIVNIDPDVSSLGYGLSDFNDVFTDTSDIIAGIEGFDYFSEKAFPQIYLPFLGADTLSLDFVNGDIMIALVFEDEDYAIGYQLNGDGSSVDVSVITEDIAETNPVWAISVNEVFDSENELNAFLGSVASGGNGASNSNDGGAIIPDGKQTYINRIFIQHDKDGFLLGKGEMSFVGAQVRPLCEADIFVASLPFRKAGNKDLCEWIDAYPLNGITYPYVASTVIENVLVGNPMAGGPETFAFVFFEKDKRKKFEYQYTYPYCPDIKLYYRSKQAPYGSHDHQITYAELPNTPTWTPEPVFDWTIPNEVCDGDYHPEGKCEMMSRLGH